MNEFEQLKSSPLHRREFLTRMTAAGLGTAAAALLAGCGSGSTSKVGNAPAIGTSPTPTPTPTPTVLLPNDFPGIPGRTRDEVVLNYALTLEILEADLYRQALNIASGRPTTQALDTTRPSSPTSLGSYTRSVQPGNIASGLTDAAFLYLVQYAYVEAAHRDFLRTVLSSLNAPTVSANALGYQASFGTTLESILNVIYTVEETGVRAYLGAAGFIDTIPTILTTAVAIHSTEARHSAAVAYVLGKDPGPLFGGSDLNVVNNQNTTNPSPFANNTFQYYLTPRTVLNAVRPFIRTA